MRKMLLIAYVCLLGTLTFGTDLAAMDSRLDAFIGFEAERAGVPGVAYASVKDGEIAEVGGWGATLKHGKRRVSGRTPFVVGSLSKSFTAIAVMQLKEAGRLDLDLPISSYLETYRDTPAGEATIRQLLSHTSGYSTWQGNRRQTDLSIDQLALARRVEELAAIAPAEAPGSVWAYSNANYQILGRLIEVLSGVDFDIYISRNILEPAMMTDSYIGDWRSHAEAAVGHRPWLWEKRRYDGLGIGRGSLPQGGVVASARDMARYLAMMMNGKDDIITAASKAEMLRPASRVSQGYGLGWEINTRQQVVFHSGASPGFESLATMRPTDLSAFVILTNGGSGFGFGETSYLRRGATALAMGTNEGHGSTAERKIAFILLAIFPVIASFGIARSWIVRRRSNAVRSTADLVRGGFLLVLALGLAFALIFVVPGLFGVDIFTVVLFQPGLGLLLLATSVFALAWAGLQLGPRHVPSEP